MYLTTIMAVPGREPIEAGGWSGGPIAEHEWLSKLLDGTSLAPPDFLFRRCDLNGAVRFLVLSIKAPAFESLDWQVTTRGYAPKFASGARLRFELRANPIVTETRDGKSQRQDVVMREKARLLAERGLNRWDDWRAADKPELPKLVQQTCGAWMQARAARHGIEVHSEGLTACGYQQYDEDDSRIQTCRSSRQDSGVQFSTVDISGELTVVDPVTFGFALTKGIGRAKAFGCGLLLLRGP